MGQRLGTSWIEFEQAKNLTGGTAIKLVLKPTGVKRVLVRLLRAGNSPDKQDILVGRIPEPVRPDGVVKVHLTQNYDNIIQLSVHGNPNPFDIPLGVDNGPAAIIYAELIR
jgi:hypothetical protein